MTETYGNNKIFKQEISTQVQTAGYDVVTNEKYETLFGTHKKADAVILAPIGSSNPERIAIFARYQHVSGSMLEKMPFLIDSVINAINKGVFNIAIVVIDGQPLEDLEDYYNQKMTECKKLYVMNTKKFKKLLDDEFDQVLHF